MEIIIEEEKNIRGEEKKLYIQYEINIPEGMNTTYSRKVLF